MQKETVEQYIQRRQSVAAAFKSQVGQFPKGIVFEEATLGAQGLEAARGKRVVSYEQLAPDVWRLSNYLIGLGVTPGVGVAIISFTRPEWMVADLAILAAGGISVAIYQSVNSVETGYILNDSGAGVVFAENKEQVAKLLSLLDGPCPIPATEDGPAKQVQIKLLKIVTFEQVEPHPLVISLADILRDESISCVAPEVIEKIASDATASLVYTSGTTGPPKGVVQTHLNHLANVCQAERTDLFEPNGAIFLFLPLAHSFARLVGYIGFLTQTVVKFPAVSSKTSSVLNAHSVLLDLRDSGAQCMPMVPRILEKLKAGVEQKAGAKGIAGLAIKLTLVVAQKRFALLEQKKLVPAWLEFAFSLTEPVRRKIGLQLFGANFKHCVSGGAKLPEHVARFFFALELPIYEGYGLTETCVATNVNPPGKAKIGSVGPAMEAVELAIEEDGEILFRGPNIAMGYLNRPTATAASWDDKGWFHTGDLGRLDEDGYLFIVGRKKEIIITAGGKKIAPQPIEDRLSSSELVSQALYYGEGQPYCIVLLTLELESVRAKLRVSADISEEELVKRRDVIEAIRDVVDGVNKELSQFESIKKFRILPQQLTIENGLLTPSFKVKRKAVFERYAELIAEAYSLGKES